MFRRTPTAPSPHADLLTDRAADASTEVFDRVPADTAVLPPVRDDASVTTGPATVVYSALEVTGEPEPPQPARPRPRTTRAARRPRTIHSWLRTLTEVRRDPMSAVYVAIIAVAAVATGWGTTVAFRPEWVPPALNPRSVVRPSVQPIEYRPPRREPQVRPSVPQRPQDGPKRAEPTPTKAKPSEPVLKHTEKPQRPVRSPARTPSQRPQGPPPSSSAPGTPSGTPDGGPSSKPPEGPREPEPPEGPPTDEPDPSQPASTPQN